VRVTALLRRSEVARISDPQADMSTAGVIIADRTAIGSGKLFTLYCNAARERVTYLSARLHCIGRAMDDKKIAALAKKNAAKAAKSSGRKGFGKKYDKNLSDLPTDEATLKERQEHERFFKEMRKREF
jgi:hypothetical protein